MDAGNTTGSPMKGYGAGMPTRPRFTAKSIGEEVNAARTRLGIRVDDIWPRLGLSSRTHWYAKVRGDKPFTIRELGILAAEFHAPQGWPIVPWNEGRAWEKWIEEEGPPDPRVKKP